MYENLEIEEDVSMANQFIAGNIAGWCSIGVSQPFDIFKTKCQLSESITMNTLTTMIKQNGFLSLYRGASSVYLLEGIITALQFGIFQFVHKVQKKFPFCSIKKGSKQELLLSGSMVGLFSSFVYTPLEYTKIHTQIDNKPQGSASRILSIIRQQKWKGIRKLYTGHTWTMLKQVPGSAIYFGGFHIYLSALLNSPRQNSTIFQQLLASGLAASTYLTFAYPFDTIKTNIQFGKTSFKQLIAQKYWKKQSFSLGFKIALMRGLLIEMTALTIYQNLRNKLAKTQLFNF